MGGIYRVCQESIEKIEDMKAVLLQLNTELFRAAGILTLILYTLETIKEGYVSFYTNPVWFLTLFIVSGIVWLFTPENVEK